MSLWGRALQKIKTPWKGSQSLCHTGFYASLCAMANGERIHHQIEIGEARERVFLPAPSRPVMVRFDRDHWIPKTLKFPRPKEMLLYQLTQDTDCMGRIEAAQELGKISDLEIIKALRKTVASDSFWGVQVETAKVLSEIKGEAARDVLIAALGTTHPKARRGVVKSLGSFRDEVSAQALRKHAETDPSYFVEADATASGRWLV